MTSSKDIHDALAQFAERHLPDEYLLACERAKRYPAEAMEALAADGWAAVPVPEEYGGSAGTLVDLVSIHEALAYHSLTVSQAYFSLWVLGAGLLSREGTPTQKQHWLPRIAAGEANIAFALTEPGSGSDAAAMRTAGRQTDHGLVVTGQKTLITGAQQAQMIITAARTDPTRHRHAGISLVMVDPRAEGVTVRDIAKIGLPSIDLCEVYYDDAPVLDDGVVGTLHEGWTALRTGLAVERILLGAIAVGCTERILQEATRYAKERTAFNAKIGSFQMISEILVRMRIGLEAARHLVNDAAMAVNRGEEAVTKAAIAKLFATEGYVSAARAGSQVFGGYGFTEEYVVGRHYRDCKYLEVGGGTTQTQIIIIARDMGLI
jgi:alkylation response protein AidB-like acyl-CoA dehydrogenase